jgi:hypothetical protein
MIRTVLGFLSAGCVLFAFGCAGVDDRREQPLPQGDRPLPSCEKDSSPEEFLRFAGPPVLPRNPRNF